MFDIIKIDKLAVDFYLACCTMKILLFNKVKGMVETEKKIKVHKNGKILEATALFDTGSRMSYFSRDFAEKNRV